MTEHRVWVESAERIWEKSVHTCFDNHWILDFYYHLSCQIYLDFSNLYRTDRLLGHNHLSEQSYDLHPCVQNDHFDSLDSSYQNDRLFSSLHLCETAVLDLLVLNSDHLICFCLECLYHLWYHL